MHPNTVKIRYTSKYSQNLIHVQIKSKLDTLPNSLNIRYRSRYSQNEIHVQNNVKIWDMSKYNQY